MIRSILAKVVALALTCGLVGATMVYPASKILLVSAVLGYVALLWYRPTLWLLLVPSLLPILDFAPWTGWFFLDELDLLLLVTTAVLYWRIGADSPSARLPSFFTFSLGFVAVAFAIGTCIGLLPLAPINANSFANYLSPYNGLRIAKGFGWALLLLPLLRRSAGPDLGNLQRYFVPGMLIGLAGACLAVVWERAVFPGLLNFSSDYRPTAPFSAMHTGGAALDAYLAIAMPFVAVWIIDTKLRMHMAVGMLLLLLGCYAGFATFSRDVYLAYACSGVVVLTLAVTQRLRCGTLDWRMLVGVTLLLVLSAYALTHVFSTSGYRGLAASLILIAAAVILGASEHRLTHIPMVAAGAAAFSLIGLGLFFVLRNAAITGIAKGPYLAFLLSASLFAVGAMRLLIGPQAGKSGGLALATAAFPCMALATGLVAFHWGGASAVGDILLSIGLALVLASINRFLPTPVWRLNRHSLAVTFFCAIVFATIIPVSSSYYLGERVSTVSDDLALRMRHWQEALDMMTPDWKTRIFGMGLGRYPDTYFWKNTHGEIPGTYSYEKENNNLFLRLGAPQYAIGYGEVLRVLQHVDIKPDTSYRLSLDVRRRFANAEIIINICERWLLYPQNCVNTPLKLAPPDDAWHHYDVSWNSSRLGENTWLLRPPVQFEVSTYGGNTYVDVDNISLADPTTGSELIRNGSFSSGNDFWFFSSDRNHFPWHIKNFIVNTFFELGWMGIISFSLLICFAIGDLISRALHGEIAAGIYLSSLAGCLVVGMFDSLFDVPKLMLLFFLVLFVAAMRPIKMRDSAHKAPKFQAAKRS